MWGMSLGELSVAMAVQLTCIKKNIINQSRPIRMLSSLPEAAMNHCLKGLEWMNEWKKDRLN